MELLSFQGQSWGESEQGGTKRFPKQVMPLIPTLKSLFRMTTAKISIFPPDFRVIPADLLGGTDETACVYSCLSVETDFEICY